MEPNRDQLQVFLDLEQTLVASWDDRTRMNASKRFRDLLWEVLALNPNCQINLFSFAVWDEHDVSQFMEFKDSIENEFNFKFSKIFHRGNVLDAVKKVRKLQLLDGDEMSQLFGKSDSWIDFCKHHQFGKAILFDDMVDNAIIDFVDRTSHLPFRLQTVNVKFE